MNSKALSGKRWAIVLVLLGTIACTGSTSDLTKDVSGVWHFSEDPQPEIEREFSWGVSETFVNSALEIDLLAKPPMIGLPLRGAFEVEEIHRITQDSLQVRFHFDVGGFDVVYAIHCEGDLLWIESIEGEPLIPHGEENPYYRVSGP